MSTVTRRCSPRWPRNSWAAAPGSPPEMPAIARFLYITIDAQDAERIADFWAASRTEAGEGPDPPGPRFRRPGRRHDPDRGARRHVGRGGSDPGRHRVADVRRPGGPRVRHPSGWLPLGRSLAPQTIVPFVELAHERTERFDPFAR